MLNEIFVSQIVKEFLQEESINVREIIGKGFMNRVFLLETLKTKVII
jgi:hypothetical protein